MTRGVIIRKIAIDLRRLPVVHSLRMTPSDTFAVSILRASHFADGANGGPQSLR